MGINLWGDVKMMEFEAVPKKWGNTVGVVIPAEVLKKG